MTRLRRQIPMAVAAAVLGTVAGLGLAQAGGDDPPAKWRPPVTDAAVPATAAQKTAFAALAAAGDPGARRGDPDRTLLTGFADQAQIGMDADGAAAVGATAAGPIWLVPVADGLCLAVEDTAAGEIGSACEPSGDVVARGTTIGDGTTIYGVVPDGVTHVTVTPDGGAPATATVGAGGVYTLPSQDATIALDGPGGLTEFDVAG
jgi:hypothetical protein